MNEEKARRLAWPIAWVSIALAILAFALSVIAISAGGVELEPPLHQAFIPIFAITYSLIGSLVATRRPRNPVGWISAAIGFFSALSLVALAYGMLSRSSIAEGPLPGTDLALWVEQWAWFPPGVLPMTFLLLFFPDGRLPSRRWRPVAWANVVGLTAAVLILALTAGLHPGQRIEMGTIEATLGTGVLNLLFITVAPLLVIGLVGSVASLVVRFRRSKGIERQQLKWMAYAGGLMILGILLSFALSSILPDAQVATEVGNIITGATQVGIVLAASIAILKYRLYDIDILINRTLVYGTLTASTMGIYIFIVGYLGNLFQAQDKSIIAFLSTGLIALLFQPLRQRLQQAINRLMYGVRDDPISVLAKLGKQLEESSSLEPVLSGIVETIALALKLPYVAIELKQGDATNLLTSYGHPKDKFIQFPLSNQMEIIGQLVVAPRASGEALSEADRTLLETIAHQAEAAVTALKLNADLQLSRQRLVAAREEERRRLRRDLHDGLGPQLASQTLTLDALEKRITQDPAAAAKLIHDLKVQAQSAIRDIRQLVYDLRPPALDELGLEGAIREAAAGYRRSDVDISVTSTTTLPHLPAAVEVAAYRIAQEALTNVIRHAGAQSCEISLSLGTNSELPNLCVAIFDDGEGLPSGHSGGVGLQSMRERAEELGGTFTVESRPEGGTVVTAQLPFPKEAS